MIYAIAEKIMMGLKEQAMRHFDLCRAKDEIGPNVLAVHHLDSNKRENHLVHLVADSRQASEHKR